MNGCRIPFFLGCSGAYSFDFLHAVARVGYDLLVGTARKARRCVPVQFDRIIIRAVVQLPIDRLAQLGIAENAEQKQMLAAAELQEAGMCCFFHLFSLSPMDRGRRC